MIRRLYVEKKPGFQDEAGTLLEDLRQSLRLPGLKGLRWLIRYDVEGLEQSFWQPVRDTVLAEPPVDQVFEHVEPWDAKDTVIAVEYLPGQFDQRADSAAQCIQIIAHQRPVVATARIYVLQGDLSADEVQLCQRYLVNAVDSRLAALAVPDSLTPVLEDPAPVKVLQGFVACSSEQLQELSGRLGLAMSLADLRFCQSYFRDQEQRDPTLTEIKLLDTYWSDHCRHTTFLTQLTSVEIERSPLTEPVRQAWSLYQDLRTKLYGAGPKRPVCLMDIALIGMKWLRREGLLDNLEESEEVNAASIVVPVEVDGREEDWLVMFKNETHNHPTEIEPFGGAATCLGGAIRDPLSGRSYVYQAMRVTGSADPRTPYDETLPGKLPQRKITREAARGYSSYGNQIGLATGMVAEIYHPGYVAKRMEIGAVIAAAPRDQVQRLSPEPGDRIVLVGGRTGRDGIGGATGSSKEHDSKALLNSAEVQKGDAPTERKLQRLFRNPEVSGMIKRCNDFGAGGVSVAIGELAPSLEIDLNAVPRKYEGLDGTELAISESQERMAVVLEPNDVQRFITFAACENLEAVEVATVTDTGRLRMHWRGQTVVDIERAFLDTNGTLSSASAHIVAPDPTASALQSPVTDEGSADLATVWQTQLQDLNICSQQGLVEMFDSTIGAGSILHPFGGKYRLTPSEAMAALIPMSQGFTTTGTLMSHGFNPYIASWSPFHGAVYAVVEAVARIVASGGKVDNVRLTLQEYFERLRGEPRRWGKPLAALLGALWAQEQLGIAAIGGKDSMSGSFNDLDVPPTLVAFAVAPVQARCVISPEFKQPGSTVWHVSVPRLENGLPDLKALLQIYEQVAMAVAEGTVVSARSIRTGGIAAAVATMCFGNKLGFKFDATQQVAELFAPDYGSLLLELAEDEEQPGLPGRSLGFILEEPAIVCNGTVLQLDDLLSAWQAPLQPVFPVHAAHTPSGQPLNVRFQPNRPVKPRLSVAKPRVVMPVFPGSNCEYDTARAFVKAGAEVQTLVFRNRSDPEVEASLRELADAIAQGQILMLPGGFSAGDEPAGSGKFIAAVLRNPRVADATLELLRHRDGLILGICNGFQALIKVGLVPFGDIRELDAACPTLTHNTVGRHISCYTRTKVVSKLTPWLQLSELGDEHWMPLSHGEGRFVASEAVIRHMMCADQICTQYVDENGLPSYAVDANPNGSAHAIEGICSPCGRVFGKMGHSERTGSFVGVNIPGLIEQPLFRSGVAYFQ